MEDAIIQRNLKAQKASYDITQQYLTSKNLLEDWVKIKLIVQHSNILKALADGCDNYIFKTIMSKNDFEQMKLKSEYNNISYEDKIKYDIDYKILWHKEFQYNSEYKLCVSKDLIKSVNLDPQYIRIYAYAYPKICFYKLKKVNIRFEIEFFNVI